MESVPHMAEEVRALTLMLPFNSPRVHPWSHTWPYVHLYGQGGPRVFTRGSLRHLVRGPTGEHPWVSPTPGWGPSRVNTRECRGHPDGSPTGVHPWETMVHM